MKPVKITPRNIMFTQPMGGDYNFDLNTGLILGKRFNFVIDTGLGSRSVSPVLEYLHGNYKPVVVVNTHYHWDHVWGNWMFKNSVIVSHTKGRELMEKYWDEDLAKNKDAIDGEVYKCLPNLLFDDCMCFPDDGVKIFYTPGHSADCVSVYDEVDKVLYAGDNVGDTEGEIVPYIATGKETFRETIEIYKTYDFNVCVSGHNKPQGKEITALMDAALDASWLKQMEAYR